MKDRREVYLADHDHLRIRLLSVSVDSIPKGGGRALFELSTMDEHQAAFVLTVEAPEFRAAAAGRIPERKYAEITAEAAARLREDLQAMIEAVDGMAEQVRRTVSRPSRNATPALRTTSSGWTPPTPPPAGASSSRPLPLATPPVAPARRRSPRATPATRSTWPPRTGSCSAIGARGRCASTVSGSTSYRPAPSRCSDDANGFLRGARADRVRPRLRQRLVGSGPVRHLSTLATRGYRSGC